MAQEAVAQGVSGGQVSRSRYAGKSRVGAQGDRFR